TSLLKSFISSTTLESMLLLLSIILILLGSLIVNKKEIILTRIDAMWYIFLISFISNIAFNSTLTIGTIIDIYIYSIAILFLLLVKEELSYFNSSLKLIKI